jgi:hypothetical protein
MTQYADRNEIDTAVRAVLKKYQAAKNDLDLRKRIIHEIYQQIPAGPAFVVICDSYNNDHDDVVNGRICVDVYFNDANEDLFCMEFVSDPNRDLTLQDAIKLNETVRTNEKRA